MNTPNTRNAQSMYRAQVFILTACFVGGAVFSACKPAIQYHDSVQLQVQDVPPLSAKERRDETTATQNASRKRELEALKNTFEDNFRDNEAQIEELKEKMKRIASLEQANRKLKSRIDTYEPGTVDWELFRRAFKYDMQALGKELRELSGHSKK